MSTRITQYIIVLEMTTVSQGTHINIYECNSIRIESLLSKFYFDLLAAWCCTGNSYICIEMYNSWV